MNQAILSKKKFALGNVNFFHILKQLVKKINCYFFELGFDLTPSKGEVVETAHTHGMDYYCSSSAPIVERPPMPPSPKSPKSKSPLPASSSSKIVGSRKKANTMPHCRKVGRPFLLITLLLLLFESLRPQRSFSKYESGPVFGPDLHF